MATITAAGAGNWSAGATWTGGVAPGDGDVAALAGFDVTMDIARVPAVGTLLSLGTSGSTGRLIVPIDVLNDCAIFAADVFGEGSGSYKGRISITGSNATKTLTVTGNIIGSANDYGYGLFGSGAGTFNIAIIGNVTGGAGYLSTGIRAPGAAGNLSVTGNLLGGSRDSSVGLSCATMACSITGNVSGSSKSYGIQQDSTGTLAINGIVTGGSGAGVHGIYNSGSANISFTGGNIVGGTGAGAMGAYCGTSGTVSIAASVNLISGTGGGAYGGKTPVWATTVANFVQIAATKYPKQLTASLVKNGQVHGDITGTAQVNTTVVTGGVPVMAG